MNENTVIIDDDDEATVATASETIVLDGDSGSDDDVQITHPETNNTKEKKLSKAEKKMSKAEKKIIKAEKKFVGMLKSNDLMDKIVKLCLSMENTVGMPRVINKTLLPLYKDASPKFKTSCSFRTVLKSILRCLQDDPDHKFLHVKRLCEMIKWGNAKRKVPFVTLSKNVKHKYSVQDKDSESTSISNSFHIDNASEVNININTYNKQTEETRQSDGTNNNDSGLMNFRKTKSTSTINHPNKRCKQTYGNILSKQNMSEDIIELDDSDNESNNSLHNQEILSKNSEKDNTESVTSLNQETLKQSNDKENYVESVNIIFENQETDSHNKKVNNAECVIALDNQETVSHYNKKVNDAEFFCTLDVSNNNEKVNDAECVNTLENQETVSNNNENGKNTLFVSTLLNQEMVSNNNKKGNYAEFVSTLLNRETVSNNNKNVNDAECIGKLDNQETVSNNNKKGNDMECHSTLLNRETVSNDDEIDKNTLFVSTLLNQEMVSNNNEKGNDTECVSTLENQETVSNNNEKGNDAECLRTLLKQETVSNDYEKDKNTLFVSTLLNQEMVSNNNEKGNDAECVKTLENQETVSNDFEKDKNTLFVSTIQNQEMISNNNEKGNYIECLSTLLNQKMVSNDNEKENYIECLSTLLNQAMVSNNNEKDKNNHFVSTLQNQETVPISNEKEINNDWVNLIQIQSVVSENNECVSTLQDQESESNEDDDGEENSDEETNTLENDVDSSRNVEKTVEVGNQTVAEKCDYDLLIPSTYVEVGMDEDERKAKILHLEGLIESYNKKIIELEQAEVVDDSLRSPYLHCDKYKMDLLDCYQELAKLTGCSPDIVKRRQIRIRVGEGRTSGPAKLLEKLLNRSLKKTGMVEFPDFCDVVDCVQIYNSGANSGWSHSEVLKLATSLFKRCGEALRRNRQRREYLDLLGWVPQHDPMEDPADKDPKLLATLEENKLIAQAKEQEILERYVNMENSLFPRSTDEAMDFEFHQNSSDSESENTSTLQSNNVAKGNTEILNQRPLEEVPHNGYNNLSNIRKFVNSLSDESLPNHDSGTAHSKTVEAFSNANNSNDCNASITNILQDNSKIYTYTVIMNSTIIEQRNPPTTSVYQHHNRSKINISTYDKTNSLTAGNLSGSNSPHNASNSNNVQNLIDTLVPSIIRKDKVKKHFPRIEFTDSDETSVEAEANDDAKIESEPVNVQSMFDELGDGYVSTVFDVEDPFLVVDICSDDSSDGET